MENKEFAKQLEKRTKRFAITIIKLYSFRLGRRGQEGLWNLI